MNTARSIARAAMLLAWLASPIVFAAEDDAKAREQFDRVLMGIEDKNFELIKSAIDQPDLTNRIFSEHPLTEAVQEAFRASFWPAVESSAMQRMPNVNYETKPEVVRFQFKEGRGDAIVRYRLPQHTYFYQVWTLRHNSRGRLTAVDWQTLSLGQSLVEQMGEELVTMMPVRNATRQMFGLQSANDQQVFQATELLKAIRDNQAPRFFEIYDGVDLAIKKHLIVARAAIRLSLAAGDSNRFVSALELFSNAHGDDPRFGFYTSDLFFRMQAYDRSYSSLAKFHNFRDLGEGGIPARLSALALAVGDLEDADAYALEATIDEPSFELGWWSLLRARAKADDFEGALVALAGLEDSFDKRMDETTLRRDPYRAFVKLAESDEFQKWRASRP